MDAIGPGTEVTGVECGACRRSLNACPNEPVEDRSPCPSCYSLSRHIKVTAEETLRVEDHLAWHSKHLRPDYYSGRRSKPAIARRAGEGWSADGVLRSWRKLVHRAGDWYEETVLNADGSIHHHEAHSLGEHRGHGSDKPDGKRTVGG